MKAPTRPVLRWHGGKWLLAPWIISHFPAHRSYVEPYGGAASVLLRKPRSHSETYNDLDDEVVNLFRVLRDPEKAADLAGRLELTPFARVEFDESYEPTLCAVESARRLVVRSFMGFGSNAHNRESKTGFRRASRQSGTSPSREWRNVSRNLVLVADRLSGVVIEKRPAMEVCEAADHHDTLHYLDPPYVPETRSSKSRQVKLQHQTYSHEMTADEHADMLERIQGLKGFVVLSGYRCELYDDLLAGWRRVDRSTLADGARSRVESLWLNERACRYQQQDILGWSNETD